jgi:RHS repeat-associated protein
MEETHYYPGGLVMSGISSKAAGGIQNKYLYNGKEKQAKEFSDGSGLEMYDFKYRFYDMQLGRFFNQDRLADKFAYMSPYQFCSNNPIWLREIDGLEGVKYTETDANGNKKTIVEKNVVVLTERTKAIPAGASQKQIDKITKQNTRIEQGNAAKIAGVKSELNTFYNGSDGKGASDSKGNAVSFKFNVTGVADIDKKGMSEKQIDAAYNKISQDNGMAAVSQFDHSISLTAPAGVLTNDFASGGVLGNTTTARIMRINFGSPDGTISHEVSHTLGLDDNGYTSGGILNSPPEQVKSSEVDEILKQAYDKK